MELHFQTHLLFVFDPQLPKYPYDRKPAHMYFSHSIKDRHFWRRALTFNLNNLVLNS